MQRKFILMFLSFSLFFSACKGGIKSNHVLKKQNQNNYFKEYLESTFKMGIPSPTHFFFLIPSTQCVKCNYYDLDLLDKSLAPKLTIISAYPLDHFDGDKTSYSLRIDTNQNMNQLAMLNYGNKIITTSKGQIVAVENVHSNVYAQLDSLNKVFR